MADHRAPPMSLQLDFCLATGEDYEGVMAISGDVYKGIDYLPVKYHSWLQDTKRRTFVAKRQGKVAALSLIFKVEETEKTVHHFITKLEKEGQRFQPPVTLQLEDVRRIYTNEKVIEKLLPAKMLIQSWLPVLPITSNLDYLLAKVVSWMADSTDEPNFLSLSSHPFKVPFGNNAYRFDINLFGTEPRYAKIHFLAQLLVGAKITSGSVLCCCLYMEKELFQTLDMFCEGIKKYEFWKEQIVMEKDI